MDDDGSGYLIYTSLAEAHSISIAPLNSDFTESLPRCLRRVDEPKERELPQPVIGDIAHD